MLLNLPKNSYYVYSLQTTRGNECGPICLRMIAKHYGCSISLSKLRQLFETTRSRSSRNKLADAV